MMSISRDYQNSKIDIVIIAYEPYDYLERRWSASA